MRDIVNAVLLRGGRVLLARRSPQRKAYPDRWSFPGGHVEAGETLEQALLREAGEEIAIRPVTYSFLARIPDPAAPALTYHLFRVTGWEGVPRIRDDEHTELRWFAPDAARDLPDLALHAYRALFGALQAAGRGGQAPGASGVLPMG